MGRNRKKSTKWSADELLIAALIFPIALICAYSIYVVDICWSLCSCDGDDVVFNLGRSK